MSRPSLPLSLPPFGLQVQRLSVAEIALELQRLQAQAAANQLLPADVSGGTITISNIGEDLEVSLASSFGVTLLQAATPTVP